MCVTLPEPGLLKTAQFSPGPGWAACMGCLLLYRHCAAGRQMPFYREPGQRRRHGYRWFLTTRGEPTGFYFTCFMESTYCHYLLTSVTLIFPLYMSSWVNFLLSPLPAPDTGPTPPHERPTSMIDDESHTGHAASLYQTRVSMAAGLSVALHYPDRGSSSSDWLTLFHPMAGYLFIPAIFCFFPAGHSGFSPCFSLFQALP